MALARRWFLTIFLGGCMKHFRRILILGSALMVLVLAALMSGAAVTAQEATPTRQVGVQPANPTPTPAAPVATREPGAGNTIGGTPVGPVNFELPPTLDELIAQYPDLQPYLDLVQDQTLEDLDFSELYARMVQIFKDHGASGLAVFLDDSGILDKLGIPVSYLDLLTVYDDGGLVAVEDLARERKLINRFDEIVAYLAIDEEANLPALRETLEGLDVSVYRYLRNTGEVEVGIPLVTLAQFGTPGSLIGYLVEIFQAEHVVGVRVPVPALTSSYFAPQFSSVGGETVGVEPWLDAGYTGEGVKVAVVDTDGFFGVLDRIDDGDLPENVQANYDLEDLNEYGGDHGTACAMIVYQAAPGVELHLVYVDITSDSSFEEALEYIADNDIQIVSYSVGFPIGPRDGTFWQSPVVTDFVEDTGVLWIAAAGNFGYSHTIMDFNELDDGWHDFGDGEQWMPFMAYAPVTYVVMNWNGSWDGGEDNNYRFVIVDENGDEVASGGESKKGRNNDFPIQTAAFESEPGTIYYMAVELARGDGDNTLDIFVRDAELVDWAQVPEYSIALPADADAAFSVGATGLTEDELETYSSQGPTMDERIKPDISAPTGEEVPGYDEGFFGTSGAAPLVAGAAALVWQAFPEMSNYEVKDFMMSTVVDLGEDGTDPEFGAGRLEMPEPGEDVSGQPQGDTAFAEVTDYKVKWNAKSNGDKGVRISISFTVENLQGSDIAVGFGFFTPDFESVETPDEDYQFLGSIGTYELFQVERGRAEFEDVSLFLPNYVFQNVESGTDLVMVVLIFDLSDPENPQPLWQSEPEVITIN
jgi:subtilisin family serine protease